MNRWLWTLVLFAGCTNAEQGTIDQTTDLAPVAAFVIHGNVQTGELTVLPTTISGLSNPTVVQNGIPNNGPNNSVELVTDNIGVGCPANSFCGEVTIRSFYDEPLANVYAQITSITPPSGHGPVNGDSGEFGLSDSLGLWSYGNLDARGGPTSGATRNWGFEDQGTGDFTLRGVVWADASCGFTADPALSTGETGIFAGMTAAHNRWRQDVGVSRLSWNAALAASSQAWADDLVARCAVEHSMMPGVGENIYASSVTVPLATPDEVVDGWCCERKNWLYGDTVGNCAGPIVPPTPECSFVLPTQCGHYTQVIWDSTTEVGCGAATNAACTWQQVWVCQYTPPGNYTGQTPVPFVSDVCVDLDNDDVRQYLDADDTDRTVQ